MCVMKSVKRIRNKRTLLIKKKVKKQGKNEIEEMVGLWFLYNGFRVRAPEEIFEDMKQAYHQECIRLKKDLGCSEEDIKNSFIAKLNRTSLILKEDKEATKEIYLDYWFSVVACCEGKYIPSSDSFGILRIVFSNGEIGLNTLY